MKMDRRTVCIGFEIALKQSLTERAILSFYSFEAETQLHINACSRWLAGMLLQRQVNGILLLLQPGACCSRRTRKEVAKYGPLLATENSGTIM